MATGMTDINNSMALTMTRTLAKEPTLNMRLKPHPPSREQPSMASIMSNAPPHIRFQNLRLDPARALEPARKKLTTIESQRIMSVFEETIRRVEVVTLLPYLMQNLERFRVSLGTELVGLLKHHAIIISSYDEIRQELDKQLELRAALQKAKEEEEARLAAEAEAARAALAEMEGIDGEAQLDKEEEESRQVESVASDRSHTSTDSQMEATMRNLSLVAQQMSHSTRNILRAFNANPAIIVMIQGELAHRNEECQSLLDYLQELKEILMHKLLTTPEEEGERMAYITEIAKRERQNAVVIEKLETELKEKIDDKNEEIRKKNDIIKRLQSDLHQIEKFSEEHIRRVRADAEKQEAADEKNSDGKRQKLQAEVAQLRSQLQNATIEHREREQELRGKKFKIETEVENWIQRYDQELGERQDEYEEIDAIYTEEKKQLHELEERFSTLEKEYNSILEERRLAREKREKAERVMAMMVKAATTIQAYWRSYKVRKALQTRKKKKGGGGGGGGKGKKGKGKK